MSAFPDVYQTNEQDQDLIKYIKSRYEQAKQWKFYYAGDKHKDWISDIKFVKGQQWASNRPKDKSSIFFNLAWALIQKELPFMTDRKPKIYIEPEEPSDKKISEILERVIEKKWVERNMEIRLPEGSLNAKEVGTGFYRPFWNKDLENGRGDVDCEVILPENVFPFAYTTDLDTTEGIIIAKHESLGYIRRRFPDKGWEIKEGSYTDTDIPDRAKDTNGSSGETTYNQVTDLIDASVGATGEETTSYLKGTNSKEGDFNRCVLIEMVVRDYDQQEYEAEDETKKKTKKKRYSTRMRYIAYAGGVILEDRTYDDVAFVIDQRNYINPGEFWGMSDVQQIKEANKELNKLNAMVLDAIRRGVYSTTFVDKKLGLDTDNFVVTSDAVYDVNGVPGQGIYQYQSQSPGAGVFAYLQNLPAAIEKIFGSSSYSPPPGGDLPSGRAFDAMKEITQITLRQKIRNMENSIRRIGQAWVDLILKNYEASRVMRLVNPQTGKTEYCFIYREPNPELAKQIEAQVMAPDPETGEPLYQHSINLAQVNGRLDLKVATGSTLASSRLSSFEQSMVLYQGGIIDQQAVLESADYPEKDIVMARMKKQQAQAQQMQQQMAQIGLKMKAEEIQTPVKVQAMRSQTELQKAGIEAKKESHKQQAETDRTILKVAVEEETGKDKISQAPRIEE